LDFLTAYYTGQWAS